MTTIDTNINQDWNARYGDGFTAGWCRGYVPLPSLDKGGGCQFPYQINFVDLERQLQKQK
jgi:hypothetical protein